MANKQQEAIKTVLEMINENENVSKETLLEKTKDMGWKPVTLNFCLKQLKKSNAIVEIINENGDKMYQKNEYPHEIKTENNFETPRYSNKYQAKKSRYKREVRELTEEQSEFKETCLDNKDLLMGKKVVWTDGNGMKFPLTIAGMGDITIRARFFLADFMESEPQTGALVYIPWDDARINQLFEQVEELLKPQEESQECVNFVMTSE